jgi:hypothetical protein
MSFFIMIFFVSWAPTLLTKLGASQQQASGTLVAWNIGQLLATRDHRAPDRQDRIFPRAAMDVHRHRAGGLGLGALVTQRTWSWPP